MRKKIAEKIDEIRKKPEHIRVWYVWIAVFIVMFFVIIIWIFTLKESLQGAAPSEDVKKIQSRIPSNSLSDEKQSLEELFKSKGGAPAKENAQ